MSTLITRFGDHTDAPSVTRPEPDKVVSGDPVFRTWTYYDRNDMRSGIWEATPGSWRSVFLHWEFMTILSGSALMRTDRGEVVSLEPGETVVVEPGFSCVWEVQETVRKQFFVRATASR